MSTIEIRQAGSGDVARAVALLRDQLDEHGIALAPGDLEHAVVGLVTEPTRGSVLVAAVDGRLVGVAVCSLVWTLEHGGTAMWLDELYVEPASRRRGVGERLVEAVIARAAAFGGRAIDLEVEPGHEAAERLYERLGFRRHRRVRWVHPIDASVRGSAAPDRRPFASIDHLSLGVDDLVRSKAFYDAALAPLGLVPHQQIPGEVAYGPPDEDPAEGFAFYIGFEDPAAKRPVRPSAGCHVALRAPSREAVRRFHRAALANGGRDLGAPGPRPHYGPHYYGAFVLDPDGHHVEAVCHAPDDG